MNAVSVIKDNPFSIAATAFSAFAVYVLPPPLADNRLFSVLLAAAGGFAGIYLGKVLLTLLSSGRSILAVAALILTLVICAVLYLKMMNSIPTPSLIEIGAQALLYVTSLTCVFTLAKMADIKFPS